MSLTVSMRLRRPSVKRLLSLTLPLGALPPIAWAQLSNSTSSALDDAELAPVVVVGKRASVASTQKTKREKFEIVDAVAAEDLQKLPDINVTDALSRVTGIQVDRDRGEGLSVGIRGLTQVETTINGREAFTAGIFGATSSGLGRVLNFADVPAEMLAGIDVYKTSSADRIEGGVAGSVDLRTRRPFDFTERQLATSIRAIKGDLVGKTAPQVSVLFSDRWPTSTGDFGLLVNLVHQKRAWREDQAGIGGITSITNNGKNVLAPVGYTQSILMGERERIGANWVMQWRLNERMDVYAELNHAQLKTREDGYQTFLPVAAAPSSSSVILSPDGSHVESLSWSSPTLQTAGRARDTIDRTTLVAIGGNWRDEVLAVRADLSHTKSFNDLAFTSINNIGTASAVSVNWSGASATVSTPSFTSVGATYVSRPFEGDLTAVQLDAEYRLSSSWLEALAGGLRYSRRTATDKPGQIVSSTNSLAIARGWLVNSNYSIYPIGDPQAARNNRSGIASALGAPSSNPLGTWTILEDTLSSHLMAKVRSRSIPLDGNFGVRVVDTREDVEGYAGSGNSVTPINSYVRYTDVLPSTNLRYEWDEGLYLRAAASKTLTRPDFNQLSPSLTLNGATSTGAAGNPNLRPVRGDNLDIAIERYVGRTTAVHATAFFKKVDGFVLTAAKNEVFGGQSYLVSRPYNAKSADIKGIELGYQQFYDFLPGWMRGLGTQANYTYVDSSTLDTVIGARVPLQNLSKHSYNIVGMYELGKISARLAYNWRSHFMTGVTTVPGLRPVLTYNKAYGWLDASLSFRLDDKTKISIEGLNLLRTVRTSYYGDESLPQTKWTNDRQIGATISFSL